MCQEGSVLRDSREGALPGEPLTGPSVPQWDGPVGAASCHLQEPCKQLPMWSMWSETIRGGGQRAPGTPAPSGQQDVILLQSPRQPNQTCLPPGLSCDRSVPHGQKSGATSSAQLFPGYCPVCVRMLGHLLVLALRITSRWQQSTPQPVPLLVQIPTLKLSSSSAPWAWLLALDASVFLAMKWE